METSAIINKIKIVRDEIQKTPPITCQENKIKQVFINILKNAIKAMPDRGNIYI